MSAESGRDIAMGFCKREVAGREARLLAMSRVRGDVMSTSSAASTVGALSRSAPARTSEA